MAGNNQKQSRHHHPRSSKSDRSVKDKRKSRHSERDSKHYFDDSKTPPLPTKISNSIDVLMKKRRSLRDELEKLEKHSDNNADHKSKPKHSRLHNRKHQDHNYKIDSRKHDNDHKVRLKRCKSDSSPEYIQSAQIESEDEEFIIEQRRKRRKQLLEQLNHSEESRTCDNNIEQKDPIQDENINNVDIKLDPVQPMVTEDITDMFSEKDNFAPNTVSKQVTLDTNNLSENNDDAEGYLIIREGDSIENNRYTIKTSLGQGVFANVVHAHDNKDKDMNVAIKIIRNNHLMYKTGLKEIDTLRKINDADPENKYHCVKLLRHFMHRGHLCLVLESMHMNLRCVLKKYGRNGINTKALMSYSRQLLLALRLLKKLGIVHADIKPDNILVNEKKNILKLCDFGSATKVDDNEATPYLVSRFYRAPEVILGMTSKCGIDVWSAACTIYEMATGRILFTGSSNNKMLKCFMDLKGRIPGRLIKKGKFKDQHFNYNNQFLLHKKDEFSGRDKVVEISNITVSRDLLKDLKKHAKDETPTNDKKIAQLKDLLDKMLLLDPNQRLSVTDCLKHPFIQEDLQK